MERYQTVFFDLDGTLTDPGVGITNSAAYALEKFGIHVADRAALYPFIGPPLQESFIRFYDFSPEKAKLAVEYYREYYKTQGIFENLLYDGIAELLSRLEDAGRALAVATSKPEVFARQILEHFEIAPYFTAIVGGNLDGSRTKKDEVLAYALRSCNVTDPRTAVMVGDREYDILGAGKNGVDSVGVLYGYGSREELEQAGATRIAGTVAEIGGIVLR